MDTVFHEHLPKATICMNLCMYHRIRSFARILSRLLI